jgi:hypothetical protein
MAFGEFQKNLEESEFAQTANTKTVIAGLVPAIPI